MINLMRTQQTLTDVMRNLTRMIDFDFISIERLEKSFNKDGSQNTKDKIEALKIVKANRETAKKEIIAEHHFVVNNPDAYYMQYLDEKSQNAYAMVDFRKDRDTTAEFIGRLILRAENLKNDYYDAAEYSNDWDYYSEEFHKKEDLIKILETVLELIDEL